MFFNLGRVIAALHKVLSMNGGIIGHNIQKERYLMSKSMKVVSNISKLTVFHSFYLVYL